MCQNIFCVARSLTRRMRVACSTIRPDGGTMLLNKEAVCRRAFPSAMNDARHMSITTGVKPCKNQCDAGGSPIVASPDDTQGLLRLSLPASVSTSGGASVAA